ncbi:HesB/IscA family protein [Acetobacter vaccinii]|uniref:Iron-sulfur cluster assembly accessory protein n=1 Tax=Acetobacter vaccinii TaxID=2592655 RepID=A0A5C1YM30_9PROT|nr:iron-sulfur cluster assembly accessory protein [Acetobacter vaccinii]QEO17356.1 iron-sulfur cluster assembly accessory protein [Acetobacter vaccinii]
MTQPAPLFSVSDSAAARIASVIARKQAEATASTPAPVALRVAVEAGGCNGFQYRFILVGPTEIAGDDTRIERGDAVVVVDPASLDLLADAELDFADKLMGAHFSVRNPNAASSCGCGTSFSLA